MKYTIITSASNLKVREVLEVRNKRSRQRHNNAFLIEGPHLLEMAANADCIIRHVFFSESFIKKRDGQRLLKRLFEAGADIFMAKEHVMSKLAETETPQGILAVASYAPIDLNALTLRGKPLIVVTEGVQDPGNLGTIIRTSDAAGADAVVILPGTCDPFMPKSLRATAGSIFNLPVIFSEADDLIGWLRKKGISLFVTDIGADKSIFNSDLHGPLALAFGNEAQGVSQRLRDTADMLIRIPIIGRAESLNVAASAAICLYETVRQRTRPF
ncbi:MAG: RNA methyltransferase [Nitrospirota bacterium]